MRSLEVQATTCSTSPFIAAAHAGLQQENCELATLLVYEQPSWSVSSTASDECWPQEGCTNPHDGPILYYPAPSRLLQEFPTHRGGTPNHTRKTGFLPKLCQPSANPPPVCQTSAFSAGHPNSGRHLAEPLADTWQRTGRRLAVGRQTPLLSSANVCWQHPSIRRAAAVPPCAVCL
jgi:hypothetical protein